MSTPEMYLLMLQAGGVIVGLAIVAWAFYQAMGHMQARSRAIGRHVLAALCGSLRIPGLLLLTLIALNMLAGFIPLLQGQAGMAVLRLQKVFWILAFALLGFGFAGRVKQLVLHRRPSLPPRAESILDIATRVAQVAVLLLAALLCLSAYGVDITGIVALGGIGGIIIGLAAKDILANLFGGLMIFLEHPFAVGDWIICYAGGTRIEGTIEMIGWRVTRVRTFDKRALYVPNALLSTNPVENPQRMTHRRIYETIGVRYCDAARMHEIILRVRRMLQEHDEIDSSQTLIVNFDHFSPSSLDFFIYTFTHTTDWIRFHEVKQDVLLRVIGIIHELGADCAFPTRRVILENTAAAEAPAG